MMTLRLVFIGKTAFAEMDTGIERYLERLRHYTPVEVHLIRPERIKGDEALVQEREGERVLRLVGKEGVLIVWDQRGQMLDSPGLATLLARLRDQSTGAVWMVIGGPLGVSPQLRERANLVLSLSRFTLPHDLARLVIAEQLYRAFTILKGEPYHK